MRVKRENHVTIVLKGVFAAQTPCKGFGSPEGSQGPHFENYCSDHWKDLTKFPVAAK